MKAGTLTVHLQRGEDIKDVLLGSGKADVYAKMWLSDASDNKAASVKSTVKKRAGSHPEWNESLKLKVDYGARNLLHIVLKDKDFLGDEELGGLKINLSTLFKENGYEVPSNWYPVFYKSLWNDKVRQEGKLLLSFSFEEAKGQGSSEPIGSSHKDSNDSESILEGFQFGSTLGNLVS